MQAVFADRCEGGQDLECEILFIDCVGFKSLPAKESLLVVSNQYTACCVTDVTAGLEWIKKSPKIKIIVSNNPSFEIFSSFKKANPDGKSILVTAMPMDSYSNDLQGSEDSIVDHVVSNRSRLGWATHDLRITIHKILTNHIFGIEKYLAPGTRIFSEPICSSAERDKINHRVMDFARACHLGQHTARMAFGITEELLMNAIYDAPAAAGIAKYQNIDQTTAIELALAEQGLLSFGCDGRLLAISSSDPFGALTKAKVFHYLKKVLKRSNTDHLIDTKKGGAGLGLFKILYSSHALVCNVEAGKRTEIMALIDINEQLRDFSTMARSIHFFSGC